MFSPNVSSLSTVCCWRFVWRSNYLAIEKVSIFFSDWVTRVYAKCRCVTKKWKMHYQLDDVDLAITQIPRLKTILFHYFWVTLTVTLDLSQKTTFKPFCKTFLEMYDAIWRTLAIWKSKFRKAWGFWVGFVVHSTLFLWTCAYPIIWLKIEVFYKATSCPSFSKKTMKPGVWFHDSKV